MYRRLSDWRHTGGIAALATWAMATTTLAACAFSPWQRHAENSPSALLAGRVFFPAPIRVQATEVKDVAIAATVSLIDPKLSKTVATALTDPSGAFVFGNITPGPDPYILEAVKGLGGHLPGNPAVRVRTVIQFTSGVWTSMTGGSVTINRATTAVSIVAGLRGLDAQNLIGKVQVFPGQPSLFDPSGTGATSEDYDRVLALVDQALQEDRDPVDAVLWTAARGYFLKEGGGARKVIILDTSPEPQSTGGKVRIVGDNIADFGFANTVLFVDATASVTEFGQNSIDVIVPYGAKSGLLTVINPIGSATTDFQVIVEVTGGVTPPGDFSGVPGAAPPDFKLPKLVGGFAPNEDYNRGYTDPGRDAALRSEAEVPAIAGEFSPPDGAAPVGSPPPPVFGCYDPGDAAPNPATSPGPARSPGPSPKPLPLKSPGPTPMPCP